ncbi:hypothetical protein Bpfe_018437, partial [Biomphalaria pfeifferi]
MDIPNVAIMIQSINARLRLYAMPSLDRNTAGNASTNLIALINLIFCPILPTIPIFAYDRPHAK